MEKQDALTVQAQRKERRQGFIGMLPVVLMMAAMPEIAAAANPVTEMIDWVGTQLTSTWARSIAIIACAVMGYMAWAQRLEWKTVIFFIVGCVFIFGAAAFVDTFSDEGVGVGGWSALDLGRMALGVA